MEQNPKAGRKKILIYNIIYTLYNIQQTHFNKLKKQQPSGYVYLHSLYCSLSMDSIALTFPGEMNNVYTPSLGHQ